MKHEVKVVITKEDAPYASKEWHGEYTIRRWLWREKQRASSQSTNLLDKETAIQAWDVVEYETLMLLDCIKEAPDTLDISDKDKFYNKLLTLDMDVGDRLISAARKINGITELETKDFLPPGSTGKATPG
jgi:hypothetical protein